MGSRTSGGGFRTRTVVGVAACLVAASGGAAGAVSQAVSVDPVEGYVERVYQDLLGRTVDTTGRTAWSAAVRTGTPRVQVANGITGSDEFRAGLVEGAYQHYLGRGADPAGLTSWLAAMRRGATIQQLEAGFLASPEYVEDAGPGWVQAMYTDVLGRDAQPAEVGLWGDLLQRGQATRQRVALSILLSDEHLTDVIDADYRDLLGRGIDDAGRRGWVSAIQAGTRYEQVMGGILASNEYWVLGIPEGGFALRRGGRVGDFGVDAPEAQVRAFLADRLGAQPEVGDGEFACPTGHLLEWDGVVLVVRTTDDAGADVAPYVSGWYLVGPPSEAVAALHTPEGLRVGDPASRVVEVYPEAVGETLEVDPGAVYWATDPADPAFLVRSVDEGAGAVVDVIGSGVVCGG